MAIIFAVIGGGAVVGIANSDSHDKYLDYSEYHYSDYSNYSDAAERRKRRIEAKNSEINNKKYEINTYKSNNVNEYLRSNSLKQQSGVTVSVAEVERDGDFKISEDTKTDIKKEIKQSSMEVQQIDSVIQRIDQIIDQIDTSGGK